MSKAKQKTTGQPRPLSLHRIVKALDGLNDQGLLIILDKVIHIHAKRAVNPYREFRRESDEKARKMEQ